MMQLWHWPRVGWRILGAVPVWNCWDWLCTAPRTAARALSPGNSCRRLSERGSWEAAQCSDVPIQRTTESILAATKLYETFLAIFAVTESSQTMQRVSLLIRTGLSLQKLESENLSNLCTIMTDPHHGRVATSMFIEGSLEAKLPTIWRDENAVRSSRSSEMKKVRREKMQVREKVGKSRNTVFFQCFVAPEGRKVGSLKRRVRRHLGRWDRKNCTPLWREAHFEVKSVKTHHARSTFGSSDVEKDRINNKEKNDDVGAHAQYELKSVKTRQGRSTFGSWDVDKVHAAVARSTFSSKKWQNTPFSDDFWKLSCGKSAHRCGAKHISK